MVSTTVHVHIVVEHPAWQAYCKSSRQYTDPNRIISIQSNIFSIKLLIAIDLQFLLLLILPNLSLIMGISVARSKKKRNDYESNSIETHSLTIHIICLYHSSSNQRNMKIQDLTYYCSNSQQISSPDLERPYPLHRVDQHQFSHL